MNEQAEAKARTEARREERRRASLYPELLRALKDASVYLCAVCIAKNPHHKNCTSCPTKDDWQALIAKAEGVKAIKTATDYVLAAGKYWNDEASDSDKEQLLEKIGYSTPETLETMADNGYMTEADYLDRIDTFAVLVEGNFHHLPEQDQRRISDHRKNG